MSGDTLKAISEAIKAHLHTVNDYPDMVLNDWFVAYGGMISNPHASEGISHFTGYLAGEGSPQGTYGVARLGIEELHENLLGGCTCGEDVHDDEGRC